LGLVGGYCGEIQKRRGAGGGTADPADSDAGAGISFDVGAGIGFDVDAGAGAGIGINMTPRAPAMMPRMTMNHMPDAFTKTSPDRHRRRRIRSVCRRRKPFRVRSSWDGPQNRPPNPRRQVYRCPAASVLSLGAKVRRRFTVLAAVLLHSRS